LRIGRLSILTARATSLAAGWSSSMPDQRGGATAYGAVRAWHGACDSGVANGFERLPRVNRRTSRCTHPSVRSPSDRSPAACLPPRRGLPFALPGRVPPKAQDTIKVGILHSLSGTMAISETTLKDVMLMLIEEQNKKGGLLGKKLEAVVVDPASNWPLFAEKARELITKDKVAVVFGCWTS